MDVFPWYVDPRFLAALIPGIVALVIGVLTLRRQTRADRESEELSSGELALKIAQEMREQKVDGDKIIEALREGVDRLSAENAEMRRLMQLMRVSIACLLEQLVQAGIVPAKEPDLSEVDRILERCP